MARFIGFSFFPIISSHDREKRLLYLIQKQQDRDQYIINQPPISIETSPTAATSDSDTAAQLTKIKIDQSGGTADEYGELIGVVDGTNTGYTVSEGVYSSGSLGAYLQGQLQTKGSGLDVEETDPTIGSLTYTTAPPTGSELTTISEPGNAEYRLHVAATGGTNDSYEVLDGRVNDTNKIYTTPLPYESGTLAVYFNGQLQTQGSSEDYAETTSTTFTMTVAPPTGSELIVTYLALTNRKIESSEDDLVGDIDGANTTFTTTTGYVSGRTLVYLGGQLQTQGDSEDWVETIPNAGTFDFNVAPPTGSIVATDFEIGTTNTMIVNPATGVVTKTASFTPTIKDRVILVDASSNAVKITLPDYIAFVGVIYNIKRIDSSAYAVTVESARNIEGEAAVSLNQYDCVQAVSDGTTFWVI